MTSLRSRIESTTRAFLSAFEEGSAQNSPSLINRDVTPTCTRAMLPASILKAFHLPPNHAFDTATFEQMFAKDIKVMKFKNNVMANLVIDTEARKASFTSIAEVHYGQGEWFELEQAWVLELDGEGEKVERVVEFCDKEGIMKMADIAA